MGVSWTEIRKFICWYNLEEATWQRRRSDKRILNHDRIFSLHHFWTRFHYLHCSKVRPVITGTTILDRFNRVVGGRKWGVTDARCSGDQCSNPLGTQYILYLCKRCDTPRITSNAALAWTLTFCASALSPRVRLGHGLSHIRSFCAWSGHGIKCLNNSHMALSAPTKPRETNQSCVGPGEKCCDWKSNIVRKEDKKQLSNPLINRDHELFIL